MKTKHSNLIHLLLIKKECRLSKLQYTYAFLKEETIFNEANSLVFAMHISKYKISSIIKDLIRPSIPNDHTILNSNLLNH